MEMNTIRKQYEQETDKEALVFSPKGMNPSNGYVVWLEEKVEEMSAKATAYERLTNGGKKTPKEVANFLGIIVAQDQDKRWWAYIKNPVLAEEVGYWMSTEGRFGVLPTELDFNGDWKDSLTMPDGWEDA